MAGFTCNIDRKGKIYRIVVGDIIISIAVVWFLFTMHAENTFLFVIQALLALIGGFTVFEGVVGWCAIRAMGFKTRI